MLIFHIMAGRGQGGAETYSADVILRLHQAGIEQCVVMHADAPRYAELEKAGLRMAPQILAIPFRPLQRFLLRRLIRREAPAIIHCWMRRAASLLPKQKTEGRRQGSEKKTLMPDTCPLPSVIGWFGGYYDPRHFSACTHFVGVTQDIVQHMIENGIAVDRAFYIPTFPNMDDAPMLDRTTLATPREAKIFLALSRLHPKKGLDILLAALRNFPNAYVWLAGDGPLRGALEAQARELGVIDRVRFLGWRTDRSALLHAVDICVLPSRYEPFGTVILEAWAAKTPLVACRSAGPAAHIEDGVNGLLVPVEDVEALASALRRVLDDEKLRQHIVTEGYAAYIKNYTPEAVMQKWIEFYQNLTGSGARAKAAA